MHQIFYISHYDSVYYRRELHLVQYATVRYTLSQFPRFIFAKNSVAYLSFSPSVKSLKITLENKTTIARNRLFHFLSGNICFFISAHNNMHLLFQFFRRQEITYMVFASSLFRQLICPFLCCKHFFCTKSVINVTTI